MICQMLGKYHKSNGDVCYGNGSDICSIEFSKSFKSSEESEVRHSEESAQCDFSVNKQAIKYGKINYFQCIQISSVADYRQNPCKCIPGQNSYNKGNHFYGFFAVGGAEDGDCQCNQSAKDCNQR